MNVQTFSYRFMANGDKFVYCSRQRCNNKLSVWTDDSVLGHVASYVKDGYAIVRMGSTYPDVYCSMKCLSLGAATMLRAGVE